MQPITSLYAHLMVEIKGIAQQDWMGFPIKILLMYDNMQDLNLLRLADVVLCLYVCTCVPICPWNDRDVWRDHTANSWWLGFPMSLYPFGSTNVETATRPPSS